MDNKYQGLNGIAIAFSLINEKFNDKKDLSGSPYKNHLNRVTHIIRNLTGGHSNGMVVSHYTPKEISLFSNPKYSKFSESIGNTIIIATQIVAMLHDIIEDTDTKESELKELFSKTIVDSIVVLTKTEDAVYEDYIQSIIDYTNQTDNYIPIYVKIADLSDNMDIRRIIKPNLSEGDIKRIKKYHSAYRKLKSFLKEKIKSYGL